MFVAKLFGNDTTSRAATDKICVSSGGSVGERKRKNVYDGQFRIIDKSYARNSTGQLFIMMPDFHASSHVSNDSKKSCDAQGAHNH